MTENKLDTEEKIKAAAAKLFTQRGYAATKTRDIAEEAGINLSLLNYYFRSKEKLFNLIMGEKIRQFFGIVVPVITDASLDLELKIELFVEKYIETLTQNPDLPIFVLNEIRNDPKHFVEEIGANKILMSSSLMNQIRAKNPEVNPVHFIMNLMGMSVFPFLSKPVFMASQVVDENSFRALMEERRKLIPIWMKAIVESK
ncbi:TetR/AcrR family transcriptional regulator [Flagellimonas pelagia]|uniref:TetR/AcrR family transcriptional regulator n=1 Tax=Flagellimonas pelagia TaxID=2306998 RepID=A0A3A1NI02_9FLAO|nr:TetR/AcrR family transcriptional regulator [Allomuricauda maritima]RIV43381.1 TetR/AcrR family transcriptional regulator [Allomuricauda maritima]TXJ92718.1 TetR/AcrR family transcriptional regulator [Allomuricauda maritima]